MVYFSQRLGFETEPSDSLEQNRIEKFKRRFGRNALYKAYTDGQEFETAVRKDLAFVMAEVVATARKKR